MDLTSFLRSEWHGIPLGFGYRQLSYGLQAFPAINTASVNAAGILSLLLIGGSDTAGFPDSVFLDPPVRRVLHEIQDTGRIAIGIISGRSLEEIRGRVGICGIIYAGNHGMEIMGPSVVFSSGLVQVARNDGEPGTGRMMQGFVGPDFPYPRGKRR